MKTRKWLYVLIAFLFLGGLIPVLITNPSAAKTTDPVEKLLQQTDGVGRVSYHAETGKVRFIGTDLAHPMTQPSALASGATAEEAARLFLGAYGPIFGLKDQTQELKVTRTRETEDGRSVVRFQQVYQGIPVVGGELVVQMNSARNVLSVNGEVLPDLNLNVTPRVEAEAARQKAIAAVARLYQVDASLLTATTPELWIVNQAILGGPGPRINSLVWRMDVIPTSLLPIKEFMLVDAHVGAVVVHFNQIDTARNRLTYTANNGTTLPGTLVCNEGDPNCSAGDNDAQKAHIYAGSTYDFYSTTHGRDSIDNAGMNIISTVHYNVNYANAFWNGQQMVYGDAYGFSNADDVVGHELTHGVTDYESHLFYYYQSGAINESFSDVWGEFVDLSNGLGNDTPGVRWYMGEDVTGLGAIRNMSNPPEFGDPDRIGSANYTCDIGQNDNGGVHTNSGVNNKAVALLTDGGSFNGQTITGIGITKVAKIYYEVNTNLFTSASDYQDLYDNLQQSCTSLIGVSGITAQDCQQVTKAVQATEMNTQPADCPSTEAEICPAGQTPSYVFFDDLENPATGNWSAAGYWYYPQNPNDVGFDATYATSGVTNFWGYDAPVSDDYSIAMNNNATLPAGTPYLHFSHAWSFEAPDYDGGVVEYSLNNGAWTDAGGLIIDNGYNGVINSGFGNPLGGRSGYVSNSPGYISSRLNLSSLAGQNVKFRFRIGTDGVGDYYGWFIDDIRIYTCQAGGATVTPTRTRTPTPTRTQTPTNWTPPAAKYNYLSHLRKDFTPTPTKTATVPPPLPNTVYSVEDSTVIQGHPWDNYGRTADMLVGYDQRYYSPALKAVRSLVQFDLSAIPAGTNIQSATLNVFFVEWLDYRNRSRTLKSYRISGDWSESSVTWNTQPSFAESYGSAAIIANSDWRYVSFDVTALVRAWVNGTYPNYGVMLRGPESAIWLRGFFTREGDYKPYLYITYAGAANAMEPSVLIENPEFTNGPSILDSLPGVMDWETCLMQDEFTECLVRP